MPQTRHPRPSQVIPYILQNTFRAIVHRTAHRPLCHEYLAPDRTTFSGLSSFYTVLWHITLKAICKITEFLTCLKYATSRPTPSYPFKIALPGKFPPSPDKLISLPVLSGDSSISPGKLILLPVCPAIQVFHRTNLCQSPNQIAARRTARSDLNIQTRWEPPI